ncbi:MAG: RsmE family RNA methyltransferase [Pelolinea sp.]|nr:RsmE family RNA methyltransferase [Pelolinea sp.]
MTAHRFFIPPGNFKEGWVSFPADLQSQISRVLRLKVGDEVEVLDNQGNGYQVQLERDGAGSWIGKIILASTVDTEPRVRLSLYFGLTQRDKVEWILQKGTEVGVAAFHPFISRRTLVQQPDSADKHRARWEAILREAAEQSGRGRIPQLFQPVKLKGSIKDAVGAHDLAIAAWEDEAKQDIKAALGAQKLSSIGLFCGPEGGFDPAEIDLMRTAAVKFFSLGKRILRMETAAILAPALALYELGEMGVSE